MQLFNVTWKWNIPNSLSLLRILLVPCFATLYLLHHDGWSFAVLALSGVTDMLDGFIEGMERVLGKGKCHHLNLRPVGGVRIV